MNTSQALDKVAHATEVAMARYPAMSANGATLAFSGGKDSIALASALAALGHRVRLRAVDMGYSRDWRRRIEQLAVALGQQVEILVVADVMRNDLTEPGIRRDLALRRAFLDSPESAAPGITPCTNCYNCKILSLVDAARRDEPTILFAHHSTDALSSFLKSAVMYIDRWDMGNHVFERAAFRATATAVAKELRAGSERQLERLVDLLCNGRAQTSEPPVERRTLQGQSYIIGRPLFDLKEDATVALVKELGLQAETSGCGHSEAAASRTPREIIHYELLPFIAETAGGRSALEKLARHLTKSLNPDGTIPFDARESRHDLLGPAYKGGPETLADRL